MKPLVSIILPTFNGERFLGKAIESCLEQTYSNLELIIVNDCSSDKTAEIIQRYAERNSRIKVITNSINEKLPASLNRGFAEAKGELFTWISDDNFYSSSAIETMVKAIQADTGTGIVYSSYYFVDEKGRKLDTFGYEPENLLFACAPGACFLYKREVHQQLGGFDESRFRMEDMDFWLRAATLFHYKYIDHKDIYYYRKHTNSLTSAIHSNPELFAAYRDNHRQSFQYFFNKGLGFYPGDDFFNLHIELYFQDFLRKKERDFSFTEKLVSYIEHLDILASLEWAKVGFDSLKVRHLLEKRKKDIVAVVVNDLIFENKQLRGENPRLAAQLNRQVSWYYKEYEVLPSWYKKIGHIIKAIQGNRSWRSLLSKEGES